MSKECFREEKQMWNKGEVDIKENKEERSNGERQKFPILATILNLETLHCNQEDNENWRQNKISDFKIEKQRNYNKNLT